MLDLPTPALADISLDDRFDLAKTRVLLNGVQAVTRLLLMQKERDRRAGLNTGGFVSGYRGSPLGGLDQQLLRAKRVLKAADVVFQPGLNEELAATALWGTQQAELRGDGAFDGVFGLWYGKGPGVDRSGDAFRHANLAGTSPHGGVIALMGDDHTAESSTTAHQSEFAFLDAMMPVLAPAGVQEILDYGALGWALSRYAGVWVGLKCVKDTIESTAVVDASLERVSPVTPADFPMPEGGLSIRTPDGILAQEARLQEHKRAAAVAWIAANKINRMIASGGPNAQVGIITLGKSYLDVRQALDDLGIDEKRCDEIGLRLFKLAAAWPIVPAELHAFADGLDLIMVIEEKRSLVETQIREELYGAAHQPVVVGKRDERGEWLFPVKGALDTNSIAIAVGERLLKFRDDPALAALIARRRQAQAALADIVEEARRTPYFCSGCPHNSSTKVPEGARAYAGIGCHYMAQFMDRRTDGFTQMGGEGANWVGEAPFSKRGHIFQNLGDGTYNHSGALALRWAIDSGVNVTYKILFNDAVAMTGGQRHEGGLNVPQIARQVLADGAKKVIVVASDPDKPELAGLPPGVAKRPREALMATQEELAAIPGATVLIYDQTCAAELRRRRKRGEAGEPDKRAFINARVCEGCGDCGVQSNCVSIQPLETEYGRKRTIDQSSCNKDFSCVDGFCPAFVTVAGAKPKGAGRRVWPQAPACDEPRLPTLGDQPYEILVCGVGGTGVTTLGAIVATAAYIEGRGAAAIDMAGLAQKGGAVFTHVKIATRPEAIHAIRVAAGEADLVLGADLVVAGSRQALGVTKGAATHVVVNAAQTYPGEFTRAPDFDLNGERLKRSIQSHSDGGARFFDASRAAQALFGASIGANMMLLGAAYQLGALPVSAEALKRAIGLNGEAVAMNLAAFDWGRAMIAAPEALAGASAPPPPAEPLDVPALFKRREAELVAYQDRAYADRYRALVAHVAAAEEACLTGSDALTGAVAANLFKLMAYKDEYEVARLYADGDFKRALDAAFEGAGKITYHLAPPLLSRPDPKTGRPRKMAFGPWMLWAFGLLRHGKRLRGTRLDPFGRSEDRRVERKLLADYEALCGEFAKALTSDNFAAALALAKLPERIRGYGPVKMASIKALAGERDALLERWRGGGLALAAE